MTGLYMTTQTDMTYFGMTDLDMMNIDLDMTNLDIDDQLRHYALDQSDTLYKSDAFD